MLALSDRNKVQTNNLFAPYVAYLNPDIVAALHNAYATVLGFDLPKKVHWTLVIILELLPGEQDPSLCFKFTGMVYIPTTAFIDHFTASDAHALLKELEFTPEMISSAAERRMGLTSSLVRAPELGAYQVMKQEIELPPRTDNPNDWALYRQRNRMGPPENDWKQQLIDISSLSAVRKVPGAPRDMTERELARWWEGVRLSLQLLPVQLMLISF